MPVADKAVKMPDEGCWKHTTIKHSGQPGISALETEDSLLLPTNLVADAGQSALIVADVLQETQLDADDPRANYMLQAGARLCKCLGTEFIPYLGVVMPSLLRSAQLKPDVNVADAGSDDDDEDDDDDEVCATSAYARLQNQV